MSRRSKYILREEDFGRKMVVTTPPQTPMGATQPTEAVAGPSKATEVEKVDTQPPPPMEVTDEPRTKTIAEVPDKKNDGETQGPVGNTEAADLVKEPQVFEKREEIAGTSRLEEEAVQPPLEEGFPNSEGEEIDELEQIRKIVTLRRDAATREAEKATTQAVTDTMKGPEAKTIAEVPDMKNEGECQEDVDKTEDSEPVKDIMAQIPSDDAESLDAEDPEPVIEISPPISEQPEETAGTSGLVEESTQPQVDEGTESPEDEVFDEFEQIEEIAAIRRMLPGVIPAFTLSKILELTAADMANILEKMGCLDCKQIPSPHRLFQCPRGHHYCFECGAKRFTKDDNCDISSGTCDHEMEEGSSDRSGSTRGIGYGLIHPDLQLAEGEIEELSKDEETGKAKCCLRIRKSMGDPMYKAMYNNTKWDCVYMKFGCQEKIYGRDMLDHTLACSKKLGSMCIVPKDM